jgi:hypothetical protein
MGQEPKNEISKAILEFLRFEYATPRKLCQELQPLFKNYSHDTLKRLIQRSLNHLEKSGQVVKHQLRPYYCSKGNEGSLNDALMLSADLNNFRHFDSGHTLIIYDWSGKEPPLSFAEYFLKEIKRKPSE